MALERSGPVGVFDSGVGGLTVHRAIAARLPREDIIYLGDTARVPYGTKSPETVIRYALACGSLLTDYGIKLLVVACNTASAYALDALRDAMDIPVLGVVAPGARQATECTRNNRIGVIGTAGTIASGAYREAIESYSDCFQVHCKACPLFVPLAEEGWTEGELPDMAANAYLADLVAADVDTIVLGCTHYPLLKGAIGRAMGPGVTLVDSAEATSGAVAETLEGAGLLETSKTPGAHRFLVTDSPENFSRVAERFMGSPVDNVEWVDIK